MQKYLLIIALLFTISCDQEHTHTRIFNKTFFSQTNGYSQVVAVETNEMKTFYVSGQIGEGEDLEAQMRSALANLEKELATAKATMKDIVKMNTYIVNYDPSTDLETFRNVRKEVMGDEKMPASTLVGVQSLALPEWLIEIEAVAVVKGSFSFD